jgi:hypothetical protein
MHARKVLYLWAPTPALYSLESAFLTTSSFHTLGSRQVFSPISPMRKVSVRGCEWSHQGLEADEDQSLEHLTPNLMPSSSFQTHLMHSGLNHICFLFRECNFLAITKFWECHQFKTQGGLSINYNLYASVTIANIYWVLSVARHHVRPFILFYFIFMWY